MKTVIIDVGHLDSDSGAVANGFEEVFLNQRICNHLVRFLQNNGITVVLAKGSLKERSDLENRIKPHCFVSIHNNSGGGDGTEIYHYPTDAQGKKLATLVLNEIVSANLNNSRGVKSENFHVLRETICPAILVECAFMDTKDIEAVDTDIKRQDFGYAIGRGILKYLGVAPSEPKPPATGGKLYRVVSGSFSDIENANKQVALLKNKGIDSFILTN